MMGGLAASIAHEVNQPLASILGSADASLRWLRRENPDIEEAVAGLAGIRAGAERAAAIIASLRALAKQDYAAMAPLRLDAVIEDVVRLTQPEVEAQAVALTCHLAAGQTQVMGDRVQLQQIVLNLVTNALDALSSQPQESRALIISSTVEDAGLTVRVEDTGVGVPPDQIDQIFMPLFTTKSKGMGMGLAIGRSIIEAHGGTLTAQGRETGGTCFTFVLPVLN
jgi:C4-dicarboxylate-specific signal transduction histidine kinase